METPTRHSSNREPLKLTSNPAGKKVRLPDASKLLDLDGKVKPRSLRLGRAFTVKNVGLTLLAGGVLAFGAHKMGWLPEMSWPTFLTWGKLSGGGGQGGSGGQLDDNQDDAGSGNQDNDKPGYDDGLCRTTDGKPCNQLAHIPPEEEPVEDTEPETPEPTPVDIPCQMVNVKGEPVPTNKCQIKGYSPSDILNMTGHKLITTKALRSIKSDTEGQMWRYYKRDAGFFNAGDICEVQFERDSNNKFHKVNDTIRCGSPTEWQEWVDTGLMQQPGTKRTYPSTKGVTKIPGMPQQTPSDGEYNGDYDPETEQVL